MSYIAGKLLIQNNDYNTSVSAVDISVNGSQFIITYIDSTGQLKAAGTSVADTTGPTVAMSGCTIV